LVRETALSVDVRADVSTGHAGVVLLFAGLGLAARARWTPAQPPSGSADAANLRTTPTSTASTPRSVTPSRLPPARPSIQRTTQLKPGATGQFDRAPGRTPTRGTGPLVTYAVEVETGIDQSPSSFARAVDAILADPHSWAGHGRWSVRRVDADGADLIIRLATPTTVDDVCEPAGARTNGYASCRTGQFVMINLDRWADAVPGFRVDAVGYRHYVINHEVGHGLGLGHQRCPGKGKLAPVMQQQTYGLDGCQPNGWPYVGGRMVSGPATP
jgi:hypothetical protein